MWYPQILYSQHKYGYGEMQLFFYYISYIQKRPSFEGRRLYSFTGFALFTRFKHSPLLRFQYLQRGNHPFGEPKAGRKYHRIG